MAPKLADRLIWKELLGPLLNSIFLFIIILFTSTYLIKVTDLLVQGASVAIVGKVALFSLPMLITQTLPMGMLLGTILAFGRLSGDSEHIALYASGVSFYRIARPVAWLGVIVACLTIVWNETVVPPATRQLYRLMAGAVEDVTATGRPLHYVIKRQGTNEGIDEFVYIHGGYDARTKTLRKVHLYKMSDDPKRLGEPEVTVYAERAVARDPKGLDWELHDAYIKYLKPEKGSKYQAEQHWDKIETRYLPENVRMGRDFKGIVSEAPTDNRQMTFAQLRDKINKKRSDGDTSYLGDEFNLWEKVSVPLASLIFGLVAAPLGIRPQRGSRTTMGFGIAVMLIFLYWVIHNWMFQLGKGGGMSPFVAAFMADGLGMVMAALLIARTRQ